MTTPCLPAEVLSLVPASRSTYGHVILLPTAAGLYRPLDSALPAMARNLARAGLAATVVEFPGQNGRAGAFSVKGSCLGFREYLSRLGEQQLRRLPVMTFGICTGGLAGLHAAATTCMVSAVFCWEVLPRYEYTRGAHEMLVRKFGLAVDWPSACDPVQAETLLPHVEVPVCFGVAVRSRCTSLAEQERLASSCPSGQAVLLPGTSHVPGIPRGSEQKIAEEAAEWFHRAAGAKV